MIRTSTVFRFALLALALIMMSRLQGGVVEPENKYGACDNPTNVPEKKCQGVPGNCYGVELNHCSSYATNCPGGGVATQSGKPTQFKLYGNCDGAGGTSDECPKCAFFYCAKAKLWAALACPDGDEPACIVAVGLANSCDPPP